MKIPFTAAQFFDVFVRYNEAVWPIQLLLAAIALLAVCAIVLKRRWSGPIVSAILAFLWLWLAVAYHLFFFARINPLAYGFAGVSAAGSAVFFWQGVIRRRLEYQMDRSLRTYAGIALVVFSLVVYPVWSWLAGHAYPAMPTFGLPCPTTLFTIGVLAFLKAPCPRSPILVPVLWCLIGVQAAFLLDVPQDLGLAAAMVVGIALLVRRAQEQPDAPAETAL